MICGVLFSITSVADDLMTPKFFHVTFFYSGLIIQLYTNCFYGSQVFVAVVSFEHFSILLNLNIWKKIFGNEKFQSLYLTIFKILQKSFISVFKNILLFIRSFSEWRYSPACLLLKLGTFGQVLVSHWKSIVDDNDAI